MQHSTAPTPKFGSPVTQAAPPQANAVAHTRGYLITGGLQSMRRPFTPATTAPVGLDDLYTATQVFVNPNAVPITGTYGATDFKASGAAVFFCMP